MDKQTIDRILNDVYMADESLRKHDKELRQMVEKILESRPKSELNESFARELRQEILARADELKSETRAGREFVFRLPKFAYALGGLALLLLVVLPFLTGQEAGRQDKKVVFNAGIQDIGSRAFGGLGQGAEGLYEPQADKPEGLGAGGGGQMTQEAYEQEKQSSEPDTRRIMPRRVNYEFVYKGKDFDLPAGELPVYKRIKKSGSARDLAQELMDIQTDLMDLSRLRDARIRNLDLVENRQFGLSLNFNLQENMISLNKHYDKWPNPFADCQGDRECYENKRLSPGDVPSNKRIIGLADEFVSSYGIDMGHYGPGKVQDHWRKTYARAPDKDNVHIPDEMSVVYPLVLNGQTVYAQSGEPTGLVVNVDIRHGKVAGAHPVMAYNFQSSAYPAVDDQESVLKLAKNGGLQPYYKHKDPTETVTVELGTPQSALFKYFRHNQEDRTTQELYVPAFIFPVKSVSDDSAYFYREAVVVPAVKDLVDIRQPDGGIGIPEPMPMPRADKPQADKEDRASEELLPQPDKQGSGQTEPGASGPGDIGIQIED